MYFYSIAIYTVIKLEAVANVDEELGEKFLEDAELSTDDIIVIKIKITISIVQFVK